MKKGKLAASSLKMKAFLKAEGWVRYPAKYVECWSKPGDRFIFEMKDAYEIALRRKSSRERAALSKLAEGGKG